MAQPQRLTAATVLAIADARLRLRMRLTADGEICAADDDALLLLDHAASMAEAADVARRARNAMEDIGELSPWLLRMLAETERQAA